jgi:hypothetical protein
MRLSPFEAGAATDFDLSGNDRPVRKELTMCSKTRIVAALGESHLLLSFC